jgi:hypothetical protein
MKVAAFLLASLTVVAAFAPAQTGRSETSLSAAPKKPKFFAQVFGMDLFAPVAKQNDYGARGKKGVSPLACFYSFTSQPCQQLHTNTRCAAYFDQYS